MECKCSNCVSILFLYRMYIYSRPVWKSTSGKHKNFFAICERFSEKQGMPLTFFFKALFRFFTFLRLMVTQLQRMQEIILGPGWKEFFLQSTKFLLNLENHCRNEGVTVWNLKELCSTHPEQDALFSLSEKDSFFWEYTEVFGGLQQPLLAETRADKVVLKSILSDH